MNNLVAFSFRIVSPVESEKNSKLNESELSISVSRSRSISSPRSSLSLKARSQRKTRKEQSIDSKRTKKNRSTLKVSENVNNNKSKNDLFVARSSRGKSLKSHQ